MKNVIVTGSTGFIGVNLMKRKEVNLLPLNLRSDNWSSLPMDDVDSVIHLAGKAHQKDINSTDAYQQFNYKVTIELAQRAKDQGVKQFVFVSTVKVYGDAGKLEEYNESTECNPTDPYGKSKRDAELDLLKMESPEFVVSIIRPPLVYGPGVKGNVLTLLKQSSKLKLLPLKSIENKRSMVYVENFIDLMLLIIESKQSGIAIAGDSQAHSTSAFVNAICDEMQLSKPLFSCPMVIRSLIKSLRPNIYERLFSSYYINPTQTFTRLRFNPKYSMRQGVAEMVAWYKTQKI